MMRPNPYQTMNDITRRNFLKLTGAGLSLAGLGFGQERLAHAIEPINHSGPSKMRLSLLAYSFRDYFKEASYPRKTQVEPAKQIDMFQFVNYCADQGWEGAELTSYYFPKDVTDDTLRQVRDLAAKRGVTISGTSVGNTFTHPRGEKRDENIALAKLWIDHAVVLGAPFVRCFAGSLPKGMSEGEARKNCIEAFEECCAYAAGKRVFLAMENHGGIVAGPDGVLEIVRAIQSPWFGLNLDTGNFHTEDPYADMVKCAPYAINIHLKAEIKPKDAKQGTPSDFPRIARILRDANYQGFVGLEFETKEDPYVAVPRLHQQIKEAFKA
jgi:sugar phosphate isomerase/epimerase